MKSDNWIPRARVGETWLHDLAKEHLIDDNACFRCRWRGDVIDACDAIDGVDVVDAIDAINAGR